jgi:hypothetical protein
MVGGERHNIRIVRTQEADDERLAIAIEGGPTSLVWSSKDGAVSAARPATGAERSLIERIALDSPEQFVLAQLRGASYFTVARGVMPEEAGDSTSYGGPLWDLVRVAEPQNAANKPQSLWRVYYINTSTGLIDRIVSEEQGEAVVAELSGWSPHAGEMLPSGIKWSRAGQVVMELVFNNVAHGPKQ